MSGSALSIDSVVKRYGAHVAVNRLSLTVPRGVVFGLLGPNGAGKTTTLRMINDILRPDEGDIRLFGELRPGREAARRIGYLPEERGLYPKMKVIETLQFFGELRGVPGADARRRGDAWLERLELTKWRDHKVQDLSKGMQQKVQFATAVLHEPELLILDEPWSGLDPINAEVLMGIVLEQKKLGRTILFSTHLMDSAERICDSVCIIAGAEKVAEGTVAELKRQAARDRTVALAFWSLEDAEKARPVLSDPGLVLEAREKGATVQVELAQVDGARALLDRLVGAGVALRRFELVEPTLHEIFIQRVRQKEAAHA